MFILSSPTVIKEEVFKPKVYEFHLRDDIECMQTHGPKEKLDNVRLNIIEENKDVINNKIENIDNKTKDNRNDN
jgi:hypothetical protein